MEILIGIVMVICFLTSLWWLIATVSGPLLFKFIVKIIGLLGTILPVIYFLKVYNII